ncbi:MULTISPECIES: hypothetical protein [unclassified Sphingomonas]|uniref:hypothetical protein n=1 Tax=unclassified Sphingomonas TaxID=196159 RepID=UPI0006FF74F2|nr:MULTISPECIES: hypothetical protein [unclassified Sphingomonas]KQM62614.1 hypothetical protein ASE65_17675 [Sphingomonas sp. Leaf16]KQM88567.1 hypothetical protein ASE67_02140 [Sphingomonas sp. Leaf23]KQN14865.1 hypothetical protein ASE81_17690 [Sphingomonas sp. Leaf29]KQN20398.1 hypothetical protein ASE83_17660 [Sphingomonas sp. Leaf32]
MQQLGDGANDLALSWMAHHVARLMTEAQEAKGAQANEAQERCRRAILDLWKARHAIFDRAPLQSVEEVGSAVRALRDGDGWFFRRLGDGGESSAREVQFAHVVDQGARAIIRALIGDAVRQGLAEEKDWIWLVRSGFPDIEPIVLLLEEAVVTSQPMDGEAPKERGGGKSAVDTEEAAAASRLQAERNELVGRLRAFASVAEEIASHLQTPRRFKPGGKGGRGRRATGDGHQLKSRKRRDG